MNYGPSSDFGILYGIEIEDGEATIEFRTNYSPCRQFVYGLSQIYPNLNLFLSFVEPYGNFQGYVECENGEVLKDVIGEVEWETVEEESHSEYKDEQELGDFLEEERQSATEYQGFEYISKFLDALEYKNK